MVLAHHGKGQLKVITIRLLGTARALDLSMFGTSRQGYGQDQIRSHMEDLYG